MPTVAAVRRRSLAACASLALAALPLAVLADGPSRHGGSVLDGGHDGDTFEARSSSSGPGGHEDREGRDGDGHHHRGHGLHDNEGPRAQPQQVSPVPEPQTWLLTLAGLGALAAWARRRRG